MIYISFYIQVHGYKIYKEITPKAGKNSTFVSYSSVYITFYIEKTKL
jgi:hypothetical protein